MQPRGLSASASPGSLAFCPACCSHRCLPLRDPLGPSSDPLLLFSPPSVTGAAWLCPLRRRLLPAFVPPSLARSLHSPPPPHSPHPRRRHSGSCSPLVRGLAPPADPAGLHFPSSPATGTHSTRLRSHTQTHTHTALPLTLSLAAAAASVWLCLSSALLSPPFFLSVPRVRPPSPPREEKEVGGDKGRRGGFRSGQYLAGGGKEGVRGSPGGGLNLPAEPTREQVRLFFSPPTPPPLLTPRLFRIPPLHRFFLS